MKFDFNKARDRKSEIGTRLNEIADKLGTEMEASQREALEKEDTDLKLELRVLQSREMAALANEAASREVNKPVDKNEILREILKSEQGGERVKREITLGVLTDNAKNNITSAGAINLTIHDLMPDLDEGLIFGKVGMKVQTGVRGNLLWPYATSVVSMEEVGETASLTDQGINFDNIEVTPKRVGATISVTNEAIDDATFDLLGYVRIAITKAQQRQLNWKTFSFDKNITGLKGPWARKTNIKSIPATYAALLEAKAKLIDAGVDMGDFCWVLDAHAEAVLKSTPKTVGQGGFIIQDGKLDGDPYFVSHYIRQGASAKSTDYYIGLGSWNYFAANQHGDVRLIIDPFTKAVKNETMITLNTRWSLTTLRPEAFDIYKLNVETSSSSAS